MKDCAVSGNDLNSPASRQRTLVASVNECMHTLKIGRAKLYELINAGELESYREGCSRKILWRSVETYIERRLQDEARRRNRGT
ncbi:helix-turn-helix domain-containing protein [Bradyrhizobium sp. S3.9.1]|jgi:excisionase family DNA binding protein|uniref:helix-turn-helix domain-containing protein n=2 Tax=unclassified Bradyrhizobium TaxID=2631580 RepID=UPI0033930F1A